MVIPYVKNYSFFQHTFCVEMINMQVVTLKEKIWKICGNQSIKVWWFSASAWKVAQERLAGRWFTPPASLGLFAHLIAGLHCYKCNILQYGLNHQSEVHAYCSRNLKHLKSAFINCWLKHSMFSHTSRWEHFNLLFCV